MGWSNRRLEELRRERELEDKYVNPLDRRLDEQTGAPVELERQLERSCPRCKSPLLIRTNRASGNQFFGCSAWPECAHTEPIPEYVRLRQAGARPLPGFD